MLHLLSIQNASQIMSHVIIIIVTLLSLILFLHYNGLPNVAIFHTIIVLDQISSNLQEILLPINQLELVEHYWDFREKKVSYKGKLAKLCI